MHTFLLPLLQTSRAVHLWDVLFGNPGRISPQMFDNIKMEVFFAGALLALLCLGIAILISNGIEYEKGDRPTDPKKRRIAFYVLGLVAIILLFAISSFSVTSLKGRQAEEFQQVMLISIVVNALIYFVLGFALSKMFSSRKIGTWFPSK